MKWIIPPENQGQIVEVSYADTDTAVYRRTVDRSDRSVRYERAFWDDLKEDFFYEPWNCAPPVPESCWQQITAAEIVEP